MLQNNTKYEYPSTATFPVTHNEFFVIGRMFKGLCTQT